MEEVRSGQCMVFLYTSQDSTLVNEVQAFGRRSAEAAARLSEATPE